MNKDEIINKISELENEIKNLKEELNKQEEPNRRWKPKFRDIYYLIDGDGEIPCSYWDNVEIDNDRYELGNVFKTKEEAEFTREKLKVLAELKEYVDDDKEWDGNNDHVCIKYEANKVYASNYYYIRTIPFNLFFSSIEQAQKAIDAIGEERLKKYYFCIEE